MKKEQYQIEGLTIAINNMDEMLNFYSSVFGIDFELIEIFNTNLFAGEWGGMKVLFCPAELAGNTAKQNRHQFDIIVPNLNEILVKAILTGGEKMGDVEEDGQSLSVGIYDPDQNSIIFKQLKT